MGSLSLSDSDFDNLTSQDVDDLYANLALAHAGTSDDISAALGHLSTMRSEMDTAAADGGVLDWLRKKGADLFNNTIWPAVKTVVCQTYDAEKSADKDWAAAAATAILATISVTSSVAILVVGIAIKVGLDRLCPAGSGSSGTSPSSTASRGGGAGTI